MATQVIALTAYSGVVTPTIRVFADDSDTQVSGSPFTLVEATNRKGYYTATFTGTLSGEHLVSLYTGSNFLVNGFVPMANASGTYDVTNDRGVNVSWENQVSNASVTTINANIGTTQPVNFTGTGASALAKGDAIDWNSVAVTGMPMPTFTQPSGFLASTFPLLVADETMLAAGIAAVQADTDNIQARIPASLVAGRMDASTGAMAADVLTAAAIAADAGVEIGLAVWASVARTLTSGSGVTVDANVVSMAANTLTASALAADAVTEIQSGLATAAAVAALPTAAQILAAGDVDGFSIEQALKLILSSAGAKLSGAATTTIVIRAADDSTDRITATVDVDGNRTAVTFNAAG